MTVAAPRMGAPLGEGMWGGYPCEGVWVDDYEEPVFGRWGRGCVGGLRAHGLEFPVGVGEMEGSIWLFGAAGSVAGLMTGWERYCWFRKAVDLAFNNVDSIRRVVWNEWTVQMVREVCCDWGCRKKFLGEAGSSSSGKSDAGALVGLMLYWARPHETWVLVLSDTKSGARQRVWKSVTELWAQAERMGCPGVLVDSYGKIRGVNKLGKQTNNSGFELLAAGVDDADSACDRLKGIKNPQVVVLADEHTELGEGVFKTAYDNLTVNDRVFYIGMANPNLLSDSFASLCEPQAGWQSIDEGCYRWRTNYGWAVRFNAERSPRITQPNGEDFHWQPDKEYCNNISEKRGGVKSRGYYRFVKAWWCPEGAPNSIYSEVEMMNSVALHMQEPDWDSPPTRLGSLDPAFSRGGDRNQAAVALLGKVAGRTHLHIALETTIQDDVMDKVTPLTHQIVRRWRDIMRDDWMVGPGKAIMDGSGGGMVVGDIVAVEWSPAVTKVNFKAKASGRTMQFRGEETGFYNKNSEMWIQPKQFIRGNQISGISKETMAEMVGREFHKKEGRLLRVQDKEEAKSANGGKSPDRADNVIMLVEHAINLGLLVSEEIKMVAKTANKGWSKFRELRQLTTVRGRKFR